MTARWFTYVKVLLAWLAGFILALIILFLGYDFLLVAAVSSLGWERDVVVLVRVLYYCATGLALLVFFLLNMEYLSRSAENGILGRSFLAVTGVQLIVVGSLQTGLTLYGYLPSTVLGIFLIAAEGLTGIGMVLFARRGKAQPAGKEIPRD